MTERICRGHAECRAVIYYVVLGLLTLVTWCVSSRCFHHACGSKTAEYFLLTLRRTKKGATKCIGKWLSPMNLRALTWSEARYRSKESNVRKVTL